LRRFRRDPVAPTQPANAVTAGVRDFIPMERIVNDMEIPWPGELLLGMDEGEGRK